ncbi:hypothetical protein [Borreliella garinii]|uniref:hypothetical protein n=1 Tax=Borreliella garinii TaxID=29519 RepID=UPI0003F9E195|nr:hypothetical protein [Borreliella garinii]
MVERINMCILLLTTILFVSCKFFGNSGASKEDASLLDAANKISNSRIATSSGKQEENTSDTTGEDKKNKSIPEMLADVPAAATSKEKQETKNKLTEEDNKKLIDFFSKTKTYKYSLDSIYNKYTRSYGTIATYGSCGDYSIGCFSTGPSEKRKKALGELKKNKLEEEYSKLSKMLKSAVSSYKDNTLEDAIKKYAKAIEQASEAENKIETVKDYTEAKNATEEKKEKSVDHLKTVRGVLPVIKKTIETACLSYVDAFVALISSLSCNEFKQAINEFNAAAKQYANGDKGDNAVDVIVGPISGMTYIEFEDEGFKRAKMFANNKKGREVENMIKAIDKLLTIYKKVKS